MYNYNKFVKTIHAVILYEENRFGLAAEFIFPLCRYYYHILYEVSLFAGQQNLSNTCVLAKTGVFTLRVCKVENSQIIASKFATSYISAYYYFYGARNLTFADRL